MAKKILRRLYREERGLAVVIVAAALTVILGFLALVVDVGSMYLTKNHLSSACDAAALAGARELPDGQPVNVAENYLTQNNIDPDNAQISINDNDARISITASRQVHFVFAGVLGIQSSNISTVAAAEFGPVVSATGTTPFGIPSQEFEFGKQYTLKEGANNDDDDEDSETNGNFGALALGESGSSNYEENIKNTYSESIGNGDWIETEPGNMSGATYDGVNHLMDSCTRGCTPEDYYSECPRVALVPVYDDDLIEGRDEVFIVGFASFLLEGVEKHGNESIVTGTFLQKSPPPETSYEIDPEAEDYGLTAVKLIK